MAGKTFHVTVVCINRIRRILWKAANVIVDIISAVLWISRVAKVRGLVFKFWQMLQGMRLRFSVKKTRMWYWNWFKWIWWQWVMFFRMLQLLWMRMLLRSYMMVNNLRVMKLLPMRMQFHMRLWCDNRQRGMLNRNRFWMNMMLQGHMVLRGIWRAIVRGWSCYKWHMVFRSWTRWRTIIWS